MKKVLLILCLIFGINFLFAQNQTPRSTEVIVQELRDNYLAQQSYIDQLKAINSDKDLTIDSLTEKITSITERLDITMKESAEANETIIRNNETIKIKNKWLTIFVSILAGFLILHIVILILKLKFNITLPYWLNTLI